MASTSTTEGSLADLMAGLVAPDRYLREMARRELAQLGPQALHSLEHALQDPDEYVRLQSVRVLGDIASPHAAVSLVQMLEDPAAQVRWAARESLLSIGLAGLPPLLIALVNRTESTRLRDGASYVLKELDQQGRLSLSLKNVMQALETPAVDPDVAWFAGLALERMGY